MTDNRTLRERVLEIMDRAIAKDPLDSCRDECRPEVETCFQNEGPDSTNCLEFAEECVRRCRRRRARKSGLAEAEGESESVTLRELEALKLEWEESQD